MHDRNFGLFVNAFYILKAEFSSTQEEISACADDAEFDEIYNPELIQRSQQALLSPVVRLDEELHWLPELSTSQIHDIRSLLEGNRLSELVQFVSFLPEIAKANVLTHVCSAGAADLSNIEDLLYAWDDINKQGLLSFINTQRKLANFPEVSLNHIENAIANLETDHARAAAFAIWNLEEPGVLLENLIEDELERGGASLILTKIVQEYDKLSEPYLVKISDAINYQADLIRKNQSDLEGSVGEIAELLRQWDEINQPVQVFEQHQGHEEGRSKRLYEMLRGLCIELANERGEYQQAKRLSEALLHTFPELESVAEALRSDVETLGNLDEQKKQLEVVDPLIEACELAKAQLPTLKAELRSSGFSRTTNHSGFSGKSSGILGKIYEAFEVAANSPSARETAFFVVRDLALFINNDKKDPEVSFRLIDGLLGYQKNMPSNETRAKLEEERSVLHRNWKMKELERQSGSISGMSIIVDEMLQYATGKDRMELLQLKSNLDKKKSARKAKWLVYGGIAAVVGFFLIVDELNTPSNRSSFQTTTTATPPSLRSSTTATSPAPPVSPSTSTSPTQSPSSTASSSPTELVERIPPVGQGLILNREQVRYCIFQGERLDAMRPMANTNPRIDRFNSLIDDYNSRCSNFRYSGNILSSVQREALSRSTQFTADARRIVASW